MSCRPQGDIYKLNYDIASVKRFLLRRNDRVLLKSNWYDMIQIVIFIAIIATAVLIYFNNKVRNRSIDRSNRLAEKQEELIAMLKAQNKETGEEQKADL